LSGAAFAALALVPGPAGARISPAVADPAQTYVEARAAAMNGDHARSASLLGSLASAEPDQPDIARKALAEALSSGRMDLALALSQKVAPAKLPFEARLLLAADALRHNRLDRAQAWLAVRADSGDLAFVSPLLTAWDAAQRGDAERALTTIDEIPVNSGLGSLKAVERALILVKFRRTAEAEPFARRAIGAGGAREDRLRLAFADGFLAAGDKARALMMIEGMGADAAAARQRVLSGKPSGQAIDTPLEALSDVLTALSGEIVRVQRAAPPIGLTQVARYANPQNSGATTLLAVLLASQQRVGEALALLRTIPSDDALASQARDFEAKILSDNKRFGEAFAMTSAAAAAPNAGVSDFSRFGDVLQAMKRSNEAANAYGRAVALARAQGLKADLWPMLLLQASALEQAHRWPEAKQALQEALTIAPERPELLNFLGYAKLERGEDVDAAEAMIRKASELAPDDASITDSLGWAQFKRGKIAEAIETLQHAAEKDPDQAEIQEHLGDALFKSGRRFEARFAWEAALVTAEADVAGRIKAKLASGLTPINAAP
jgi:tetratricopeptide (TPR) repeat protein